MTEEQRFRLAAKACGKDLMGWEWFDSAECFHRRAYGLIYERWNPRDDDGDSRRLQVDCEMQIEVGEDFVIAYVFGWGTDSPVETCKGFSKLGNGADKHAATRLAVLNCAVAIGEAMG